MKNLESRTHISLLHNAEEVFPIIAKIKFGVQLLNSQLCKILSGNHCYFLSDGLLDGLLLSKYVS